MSLRRLRNLLYLALGGVVIASPALAAETALHTGTIVSENTNRDTITIEEMGPWHGPATQPVRHECHLTPATTIELAARKTEPGGLHGVFVDHTLKMTDLRPGDYATVTVKREGAKAIATKIEVVRPHGRMGSSAPSRV
jgi:hypothetical protein